MPNLPPLKVDFDSPIHSHPDYLPDQDIINAKRDEKVSPSDLELRIALLNLKGKNPTLGIAKTHQLLCEMYTGWKVSEKRVKKVLKEAGLVLANEGSTEVNPLNKDIKPSAALPDTSQPAPRVHPTSKLIPSLDAARWSQKVAVKYFDRRKGKGLVATEDIKEGEVLWNEDPWILAPEWDIYDLQTKGGACGFCSTPLDPSSPLVLACPSTSSLATSSGSEQCSFRFCSRLCLSRAQRTHPLLCPTQNPASIPLLAYARSSSWMALHAVSQTTARLLLSAQHSLQALAEDFMTYQSYAVLGLEERFKWSFRAAPDAEPDRETWKKAWRLFCQAFKEPKTDSDRRKLRKLVKKTMPGEVDEEIFGYDGFLRGLGKMSLNLEAHGGLYVLHSHLNHSCSPTLSCRHLDRSSHLSRITLISTKLVKKGDELTISYVNPDLGVEKRREELRQWGWGECTCIRCVGEWRRLREERKRRRERSLKDGSKSIDIDDLAAEVKAGLGVF